jgi:hypothetical protein
MSFTRSPLYPLFSLLTNLTAIGGATYYLQTWHKFNYEEHEARMDELEGTLSGHIGYATDIWWVSRKNVILTASLE